jgi:hypothetical protein
MGVRSTLLRAKVLIVAVFPSATLVGIDVDGDTCDRTTLTFQLWPNGSKEREAENG